MIVAIGGSASVGKTTLADALQGRVGSTEVVHVDDLRPKAGPSFIDRTRDVWLRPPRWLCDRLIEWTVQLHPLIQPEVARLMDVGHGIVEGQGIEPRLIEAWDPDVVRSVYVIETDPEVLHHTFGGRASASRFLALSPTERNGVVEMNRRYGLWLRDAADAAGQVWLDSQPWSTLAVGPLLRWVWRRAHDTSKAWVGETTVPRRPAMCASSPDSSSAATAGQPKTGANYSLLWLRCGFCRAGWSGLRTSTD